MALNHFLSTSGQLLENSCCILTITINNLFKRAQITIEITREQNRTKLNTKITN